MFQSLKGTKTHRKHRTFDGEKLQFSGPDSPWDWWQSMNMGPAADMAMACYGSIPYYSNYSNYDDHINNYLDGYSKYSLPKLSIDKWANIDNLSHYYP